MCHSATELSLTPFINARGTCAFQGHVSAGGTPFLITEIQIQVIIQIIAAGVVHSVIEIKLRAGRPGSVPSMGHW